MPETPRVRAPSSPKASTGSRREASPCDWRTFAGAEVRTFRDDGYDELHILEQIG